MKAPLLLRLLNVSRTFSAPLPVAAGCKAFRNEKWDSGTENQFIQMDFIPLTLFNCLPTVLEIYYGGGEENWIVYESSVRMFFLLLLKRKSESERVVSALPRLFLENWSEIIPVPLKDIKEQHFRLPPNGTIRHSCFSSFHFKYHLEFVDILAW